MRIVITGANGQLGSELKDLFVQRKDIEAIYLDKEELPLEQTTTIQTILKKHNPQIILHCGAYTAVDKAESEPVIADAINHLASAEIAKYSHQNGVKLIAISTDYVFDGNSEIPLTEKAPVSPINVYGLTKLKAEEAITTHCPDAIIIRTAWVYSTYGNNFVKTMIKLMTEREEISVINDQIGSPTYAKDLAKAMLSIIDSKQWIPGIYHYSNEGKISWYDFAEAIRQIQSLQCTIHPIATTQYPTPARRPRFSLLDKSKIKQTYQVEVPHWKESLKQMLTKITN